MGLGASLVLTAMPTTAAAVSTEPDGLPKCEYRPARARGPQTTDAVWQVLLDEDGVVMGHELRFAGGDIRLRMGARAFATEVDDRRVLLGERSGRRTHLVMVDTARRCAPWARTLDQLVYPAQAGSSRTGVRFRAVEPGTRRMKGTFLLDTDTGASSAVIDEGCPLECEPNDGGVGAAVILPLGAPRPVPVFSAGGWPRDKRLTFRWQAGAVPPDWAKGPLKATAADASTSSAARSPDFEFKRGVANSIRYTPSFPSFCRSGIACAQRLMYSGFWTAWIRPHGTEFLWGTLRWCQKRQKSGCFDVRRVLIHELGHVTGLNHPETLGIRLPAHATVMHAITPADPSAGSSKHRFGACDVASLQELYDVPRRKTRISRCNDVATSIRLWADETSVKRGSAVHLKAELKILDKVAYGRLGGNLLDGRSVKLRYRKAGSDDAWITIWMKTRTRPGRYGLTIEPQATWEFRAVFPKPADEGLRFSRSQTLEVKVRGS
jgi:hypothetical protein